MHAQSDSDVRGLSKGSMLCRIVTLTEVVHAVAGRGGEPGNARTSPRAAGPTHKYRMTTCMDVGGS